MVHLAFWFQIRHKAIVMHRPRFRKLLKVSLAGAIKEYFPFKPRFILAVAGSGGHTTELLNILTHYEPFNESSWRRWVVNEGDQGSINRIDQYELALKIKRRGRVSGAYQMFTVPRARKVGQSWLTTLLTTPYSCLAIAKVFLTGLPENTFCQVTYPHVILINGPGTAFAAALVIYLLKLTGIAPINRCKIIFIESITRVNSLSLTGKFLYYMNIADFFIVQHSAVEKKYEGIHLESYLCARQWTLSMHNRH
ncbi:oligosaccharide biosynthesis protein Alg14 like-domain-containing protein [Xylariales sp. AK1849]|nr:oligosaccharide biosynthesis protein Alg14 like-domain-containing protein [Xylariales sp. AK1849]